MSKDNNLTDFLTDVADAIREKKGTTDLINPQDFSDEIKSIKTSTSMWTGHVDVEGLKAIGWDDEDIAYYQEHGVNWMEEDDEFHKVSEDNKALYGVLTADNIQEYKDRVVWLPKIDWSETRNIAQIFKGCYLMKGLPMFNKKTFTGFVESFRDCTSLTCVPPLDYALANYTSGAFRFCYSLQYVPPLVNLNPAATAQYMFTGCVSLTEVEAVNIQRIATDSGIISIYGQCRSLKRILGEIDALNKNITDILNLCNALTDVRIRNLSSSLNLSYSAPINKASLLFMITNEAATSAITISLHADAYARLSQDADIIAALNNHPLVSLASA